MVFDVFRLRTSTDLVRYFLVDNGGEVNTFIAHLVYWGARDDSSAADRAS